MGQVWHGAAPTRLDGLLQGKSGRGVVTARQGGAEGHHLCHDAPVGHHVATGVDARGSGRGPSTRTVHLLVDVRPLPLLHRGRGSEHVVAGPDGAALLRGLVREVVQSLGGGARRLCLGTPLPLLLGTGRVLSVGVRQVSVEIGGDGGLFGQGLLPVGGGVRGHGGAHAEGAGCLELDAVRVRLAVVRVAALDGAEDGATVTRQEGLTQQRSAAGTATEAGRGSVPVETRVRHLTLVHPDGSPARLTVLGVHALEAGAAVRPTFAHDVALASQMCVAFKAAEVLHVPAATLRLRALVREDDLEREKCKAPSAKGIQGRRDTSYRPRRRRHIVA